MQQFDDLTPEEDDVRDLLSNPKRAGERKEWARESLQRWAETPAGKTSVEAWERATAEQRTWPGWALAKEEPNAEGPKKALGGRGENHPGPRGQRENRQRKRGGGAAGPENRQGARPRGEPLRPRDGAVGLGAGGRWA